VTKLNEKLSRISDSCNWAATDQSRARAKAADALKNKLDNSCIEGDCTAQK
jgi:hypothetical protein